MKVNEIAADLLGAGGFSVTVPLVEGENVLEATAVGVTGQTVVSRITVVRKMGGAEQPEMAKGGLRRLLDGRGPRGDGAAGPESRALAASAGVAFGLNGGWCGLALVGASPGQASQPRAP